MVQGRRSRSGPRVPALPYTDRGPASGRARSCRLGRPHRPRVVPGAGGLCGARSLPLLGRTSEDRRMRLAPIGAGVAAWIGAALSSLCCLLPLTIIVLGLGSGAFMAVTMQYRWILIPAGVLGVTAGVFLYLRERKRCHTLGCRMAGSRVTLALLILASLVVATSAVLDRFPEVTSTLLARFTDSGAPDADSTHDMQGMDMKEKK